MEDIPSTPAHHGDERRPDGRFGPGNRLGQGNKLHKRMAELRTAAVEAASPALIAGLMKKMAKLAFEDGDVAACKLFMSYAMGPPPQAIELSNADGSPVGLNIGHVTAVILSALGDDHDARHRVARALLSLGTSGGDGGPDDEAGD